ncbi:MAG: hypothetical protein KDA22_13435 [Phycisphaerales bacterium]|nr:hypothetical protein [Phycisphaerales bacterium]
MNDDAQTLRRGPTIELTLQMCDLVASMTPQLLEVKSTWFDWWWSTCPTDLNGDFVVDAEDLGIVLADWGTQGPGDFKLDIVVDGKDIGDVLTTWGPCP